MIKKVINSTIECTNKVSKYSEIFPWNEFYERYTQNHEEFCFMYLDYKIELVCEGTCYPIVLSKGNTIKHFEYTSPLQALKNFKIDGKLIQEIWDDLH